MTTGWPPVPGKLSFPGGRAEILDGKFLCPAKTRLKRKGPRSKGGDFNYGGLQPLQKLQGGLSCVCMARKQSLIPARRIEQSILLIRGHKVMLDADLAELYGVQTFNLNKAVKRNLERFPKDFMFQLSKQEFEILRSQFVTSNLRFQFGISKSNWGGRRTPPYVFTEQGVAMLSSVLRSKRAIQVNVEIMRAFVHMRQLIASQRGLMQKILAMEKKYDVQFKVVFEAIRQLMEPPKPKSKRQIGFRVGDDE